MTEIFMLEKGELSDWEKGFITSIKRCKTLSEKQQACYNKIRDKYLQAGTEDLPNDPSDDTDDTSIPF